MDIFNCHMRIPLYIAVLIRQPQGRNGYFRVLNQALHKENKN